MSAIWMFKIQNQNCGKSGPLFQPFAFTYCILNKNSNNVSSSGFTVPDREECNSFVHWKIRWSQKWGRKSTRLVCLKELRQHRGPRLKYKYVCTVNVRKPDVRFAKPDTIVSGFRTSGYRTSGSIHLYPVFRRYIFIYITSENRI